MITPHVCTDHKVHAAPRMSSAAWSLIVRMYMLGTLPWPTSTYLCTIVRSYGMRNHPSPEGHCSHKKNQSIEAQLA